MNETFAELQILQGKALSAFGKAEISREEFLRLSRLYKHARDTLEICVKKMTEILDGASPDSSVECSRNANTEEQRNDESTDRPVSEFA